MTHVFSLTIVMTEYNFFKRNKVTKKLIPLAICPNWNRSKLEMLRKCFLKNKNVTEVVL